MTAATLASAAAASASMETATTTTRAAAIGRGEYLPTGHELGVGAAGRRARVNSGGGTMLLLMLHAESVRALSSQSEHGDFYEITLFNFKIY